MLSRWTLTLLASLALTACGGGGNNDSGGSKPSTPPPVEQPTPPDTVPPPTSPPDAEQPGTEPPVVRPPDTDLPETQPPVISPPVNSRISQALRGGDSRLLLDEDRAPLLQTVTDIVRSTRQQQQSLITQLITDQSAASLDFTSNSHTVWPLLSSSAVPLLIADNGNVLASVSTAQGGRSLGYGKDCWGSFHRPLALINNSYRYSGAALVG